MIIIAALGVLTLAGIVWQMGKDNPHRQPML